MSKNVDIFKIVVCLVCFSVSVCFCVRNIGIERTLLSVSCFHLHWPCQPIFRQLNFKLWKHNLTLLPHILCLSASQNFILTPFVALTFPGVTCTESYIMESLSSWLYFVILHYIIWIRIYICNLTWSFIVLLNKWICVCKSEDKFLRLAVNKWF